MKRLAIIPARGGSKRIPRKNVKDFLGQPIIAYSIKAAIDSSLFDEVMVSTDDNEIAEIAIRYGATVPFFRSNATANDYATTAEVLLEVLECYKERGEEFDELCCIYATSPLMKISRLKEAYRIMEEYEYDSVFAMVQYSYPPQRSLITKDNRVVMQYPEHISTRSQDLSPIYHDAGQFYILKITEFLKTAQLWGNNTGAVILSDLEVQDLDTSTDWTLAELKYKIMQQE